MTKLEKTEQMLYLTFPNKYAITHSSQDVVNNIERIVSDITGIPKELLHSRIRLRPYNDARQMCMMLIFKFTALPKLWIAKYYDRHHSSVIHGIRCIEARAENDRKINRYIWEACALIENKEYTFTEPTINKSL